MGNKEPRIDAYIEKSADFAKPILKHFRKLVHQVCPEVEEKWKWSFPHFDYHGGPMAHMAAFKAHCSIGFWKAALMENNGPLLSAAQGETAMGHFGKITSLKDLPADDVLAGYLLQGMKLNETGVKMPARKNQGELEIPDYFSRALLRNKKARETFDNFSNSARKEYITWITEAKTEATREKRMQTALEWLSEGKKRNWKYEK